MIRHAGLCWSLAMPVGALPVTMIEPAFFASLMAPVGGALLFQPGLLPALLAAIAMPAITMRADVEDRVAVQLATRALP